MKMLAELLPVLLRQWPTSEELTEQVVLALWKKVVGEPLARRTRPPETKDESRRDSQQDESRPW